MEIGEWVTNSNTGKMLSIEGKEQTFTNHLKNGILTVYTLSDGSRWCEEQLLQSHTPLSTKNSLDHNSFINRVIRNIRNLKYQHNHNGTEPRYNLGFWNGLEYAEAEIEERPAVFQKTVAETRSPDFDDFGSRHLYSFVSDDGKIVEQTEFYEDNEALDYRKTLKGSTGKDLKVARWLNNEGPKLDKLQENKSILEDIKAAKKMYEKAAGDSRVAALKHNALEDILSEHEGRPSVHLVNFQETESAFIKKIENDIRTLRDKRYGRPEADAIDMAVYNGMELALSMLEQRMPVYKNIPKVQENSKILASIAEFKRVQDELADPKLYNIGFWNGLESIQAFVEDRAPSYKSLMIKDDDGMLIRKTIRSIVEMKSRVENEVDNPQYCAGYWNGLEYAESLLQKRNFYGKGMPEVETSVGSLTNRTNAISSEELRRAVKIQDHCTVDAYSVGMYNGLELALAWSEGREPKYKDVPNRKPRVGDMVHYVDKNTKIHLPAIITNVNRHIAEIADYDLLVYMTNFQLLKGVTADRNCDPVPAMEVAARIYSEDQEPGTWHWPEEWPSDCSYQRHWDSISPKIKSELKSEGEWVVGKIDETIPVNDIGVNVKVEFLSNEKKKPKKKSESIVSSEHKEHGYLYFYTCSEFAEKCKEFGTVTALKYKENFYWLQVDARYDFDEVVKFINNA